MLYNTACYITQRITSCAVAKGALSSADFEECVSMTEIYEAQAVYVCARWSFIEAVHPVRKVNPLGIDTKLFKARFLSKEGKFFWR